MKDYDELLRKTKEALKTTKKAVCKHCRNTKQKVVRNGLCNDCDKTLTEKRKAALAKRVNKSGAGYCYVYDENGKMVLQHRYEMEKYLGRKLLPHEVVLHRDGDKTNNKICNLVLGFRNGIPLDSLKCDCCGSVGKFTLTSAEHSDEQTPLLPEDHQFLQELDLSPNPLLE